MVSEALRFPELAKAFYRSGPDSAHASLAAYSAGRRYFPGRSSAPPAKGCRPYLAKRIPRGTEVKLSRNLHSDARRPEWITFDCYGTLIQWDEGLQSVAGQLIARKGGTVDSSRVVELYDQHESELQRNAPFRVFREIAATAFRGALRDLGTETNQRDGQDLIEAIPGFAPFAEAVKTLTALKTGGFQIALISNTDDDLVAGSVAQLGGHVDEVVSSQQAHSYKPSRLIFEHALRRLGTGYDQILHICASPALDHAAARDQQFRCIWIDRGTYRKPLADYHADETFSTLSAIPDLFTRLQWMQTKF